MTLIELIIGIGITIILISIVFPKNKMEKYNLESFARQLVSDIRYVRNMNINGNSNYYIEQKSLENPPKYVLKKNSDTIKSVSLPKNSKLICPSNIIKFKSDGTLSTRGETIVISLESLRLEITIIPFSGRVLLKEGKYAS
ncbi:MAG: hypothetical protein ACRCXT_20450 [Paraclostridium sp.]